MSLREHLCRERWNLGFIPQSVSDIAQRGIASPIQWLPDGNKWEFRADPACFTLGNKMMILVERLNYWNERGEIWGAVIPTTRMNVASLNGIEFRPFLRSNFHLSYPFPFLDGKTLYLVCETWETGGLYLWRRTHQGWQIVDRIIDQPIIDATVWRGHDRWWMFAGLINDSPNKRLHIFYADHPEGPWYPHANNPVKCDIASSRPAGAMFYSDGKLIRPTQDCSRGYGGAITLNVVETLDLHSFSEYPLRTLKPDQRYPDGMHTICAAGSMTIVDGKQWDSFQPADIARKLVVPWRKTLRRLLRPRWSGPQDLPMNVECEIEVETAKAMSIGD